MPLHTYKNSKILKRWTKPSVGKVVRNWNSHINTLMLGV